MTVKPDQIQFANLDFFEDIANLPAPLIYWTPKYRIFKFVTDKGAAVVALPVVLVLAACLLVLNPFLNPGPLFFKQDRMGMGGKRFRMWKFRTMRVSPDTARAHDAPLETHRITRFAAWMRRCRIDEVPNFFNVLLGQMSLVGPRPDAWDHSARYVADVLHYSDRFRVRPGITGLAQVHTGYADTGDAIRRKALLDRYYVKHSRIRLELYIMWRTVVVIVTGFGAR